MRTSLFLSDQGASNGDIHGASEFTSHRRSVAEDADWTLADVSLELSVASSLVAAIVLLLVVAEGGKYHALAVGSCSDYAEGEFVGPPVVVLLFLLS